MRSSQHFQPRFQSGFTMVEVLISSLLILVALSSILAMNAKSIQTLRSTQQILAGSLILQQRVETIRGQVWPEISNAIALAGLMETPTDSERELAAGDVSETVRVSVPEMSAEGMIEGAQSFSVRREKGAVTVVDAGDFGREPTLLFTSVVKWRDASGAHERELRTVICRAGLTRSGIFGSTLGFRGGGSASQP